MRHWPSGVNSKERGVREGSSALSARLAFNVFLFLVSDSRPRTLYESLRLSSGRNEGARDIRRTGKAKSKEKKKRRLTCASSKVKKIRRDAAGDF